MKLDHLMEMAYPQKVARDIIIGMARPINQHLVKLAGFDFPTELRAHCKPELRNWLDEIQRIRLKPTTRTGSFRFYFDRCSTTRSAGSKLRTGAASSSSSPANMMG